MNEMTRPLVATASENGVATLSLGAFPAHPLSLAMINALQAALDTAQADPAVRVIVFEGAGHIFCAGHDLKEIARHRDDPDQGRAFLTGLFAACATMMQTVATSDKPTIAKVDGIATAAGLQLAASCDLAIVSQRASFCLPGLRRGGFCTTPSVAVSRQIGRAALNELLLTGTPHDADWALRVGLVARVVPPAELGEAVRGFASELAAHYTDVAAHGRRVVREQADMALDQAYAHATEAMIAHFMDPVRLTHEAAHPIGKRR